MPRTPLPLPPQNELRQMLDYKPESGLLIWRYRPELDARWNNRFAGKVAGHISKRGYVQVQVGASLALAHRVIWKWLYDEEPDEIDHRDCSPTNNRAINLRPATHSQNMANRGSNRNRSLPKGVSLTARGRYRASINIEGRTVHIGNYKTPEEASAAFGRAVVARHGEFARAE
jgi:hypothetical protein